MTVRRLAILLSIVAISLFTFNAYNRPSQAAAVCVDSRYAPSKIISACTELIESSNAAPTQMVSYLNYRSWAFKRDGDLEAAIADLDRALELKPDILRTWINRAYIHDAAGDIDAVVEDFDAALALEPDRTTTFMHRAKLNYLRGEYELAQQDYERVLQLDPSYTRASFNLIATYVKLENYNLAIDFLNQMAINPPESAGIYAALGLLYFFHNEDYEKALQAFDRLAELQPDNKISLLYHAMVYFRNGNNELGTEYIVSFSNTFPESVASEDSLYSQLVVKMAMAFESSNHFFEGLAYSSIGMPDRARESFRNYIDSGGLLAQKTMNDLLNKFAPDDGASRIEYPSAKFDEALNNYILYLKSQISLQALVDELFSAAIR